MSERAAMLEKWRFGYSVTELAEEFGVSRPTVYKWIRRGEEDLADRPPVARHCPHRTAPEITQRIIDAKLEHDLWGPAKLIQLLEREQPHIEWPASSTAGRILDAHHLVKKRRARRRSTTILHARKALGASESGEMMTIDHKGQFRLGDRSYCYPLTINDPVSRFVYAISAAESTATEPAKRAMEAVFREHGVPRFIGSDNGGPFCCTRALGGLSRLSAWWIRLGVTPVRIHAGCPWENGIHERMHKTLKAHTTRPPAGSMRQQQARFDAFRREFNNVRPHQALNGATPAQRLKPCDRAYPNRLPAIEYPGHLETRRVRQSGEIKFQGKFLFVTATLTGEVVGLEEIDDDIWALRYAHVELGLYDGRTKSFI